jgi:hypothetical protein
VVEAADVEFDGAQAITAGATVDLSTVTGWSINYDSGGIASSDGAVLNTTAGMFAISLFIGGTVSADGGLVVQLKRADNTGQHMNVSMQITNAQPFPTLPIVLLTIGNDGPLHVSVISPDTGACSLTFLEVVLSRVG